MEKILTENVIDLYKVILEQERANYAICISILLGITVILLGATWWWNKNGASKEITSEVERRFLSERESLIKEFNGILNSLVANKINEYETKITVIESDVARSMAISASSQSVFTHAVYWWSEHTGLSLALKDDAKVRLGVDHMLYNLNKLLSEESEKKALLKGNQVFTEAKIHNWKKVMNTVDKIPEFLNSEKNNIKLILKGRDDKEMT